MLSSFILDNPEERYKKFELEHGDLLLRVPHHIIASYLGITPVSLSRIRKRLMK
jgi:CRP-like cAMP-binding protein